MPAEDASPAQLAFLSASSFVAGLVGAGVQHAVICPGSRSTPMTLALARSEHMRKWVLVDERSAAFFALGMAKAIRGPVVILCTSGTAAANFLPATVEASYSAVPLILLTADRPPELRGTGALQTIDQIEMYGRFVRAFHEVPVPGPPSAESDRNAFVVASRAVREACDQPAGPVHVNLPYREPFVPESGWVPALVKPEPDASVVDNQSANPALAAAKLEPGFLADLTERLKVAKRVLIVAGAQYDQLWPEVILALARRLGFPILADPLSQLRSYGLQDDLIVDSSDLILRSPRIREHLQPDLVLRFGMTPVSKPVLSWLEGLPREVGVSIHDPGLANDPGRVCGFDIAANATELVSLLVERLGYGSPPLHGESWLSRWRSVADAAASVAAGVGQADELDELSVARIVSGLVPEGAILWVGASMPLRDIDTMFRVSAKRFGLLGNRGVNGIDGIVSSGLGAAAGSGKRVVLFLGDLSLYHDMNGLLAAKKFGLDATVVVVNNGGGGIFSFLPQVEHDDVFERYFATPTGLSFESLAALFDGHYGRAADPSGLVAELESSWDRAGLSIVEVATDRTRNVAIHERLWSAAISACDNAFTSSLSR